MHCVASIPRNCLLFEIPLDQFFPQIILVGQILSPQVLLEILLPQVVPEFAHADLPEVEGQWERLGSLADRNAVPGQVAK